MSLTGYVIRLLACLSLISQRSPKRYAPSLASAKPRIDDEMAALIVAEPLAEHLVRAVGGVGQRDADCVFAPLLCGVARF
jgi:hypothetical protein